LSEEQFDELSRDIDVIYHNGALVNGLYPYQMLKGANVLGTQEVLRLSCRTRIKPVHYVSTISVFSFENAESSIIEEKWIVDGGNSLRGGYAQSKWVAERLVAIAAARGLPVAIYRPGRVSGDSRTGTWLPDPLMIDSLQTIFDLGSVPRVNKDMPIELVPVDYVARAIVHLSQKPESLGSAFHLANPYPVSWGEFVERLRRLGVKLEELDPEPWMAELLRFARRTPANYLNPMVPLLPGDLVAKLENLETTAVPATSSIQVTPFYIDCTRALAALKDTGVNCLPVRELLDIYLSYFVGAGLLVPRSRNDRNDSCRSCSDRDGCSAVRGFPPPCRLLLCSHIDRRTSPQLRGSRCA
jgi:thioester reductase-like protein